MSHDHDHSELLALYAVQALPPGDVPVGGGARPAIVSLLSISCSMPSRRQSARPEMSG